MQEGMKTIIFYPLHQVSAIEAKVEYEEGFDGVGECKEANEDENNGKNKDITSRYAILLRLTTVQVYIFIVNLNTTAQS